MFYKLCLFAIFDDVFPETVSAVINSFQEGCKTLVFAFLGLGLQCIDRQNRALDRKDPVHERSTVRINSRHLANPLCEAFGCLEHGVEIVVLHQLDLAVFQDFRMDLSSLELGPYRPHSSFSLFERLRRCAFSKLAVGAIFEAGEG